MANVTVTAAEFEQRFGCYRDAAQREPVSISSDRGDMVVIMSEAEYRRLKLRDREVLYAWELSEEDAEAIAKAEPPPEAVEFDEEMKAL